MTVAELIAALEKQIAGGLAPDTTVWRWVDDYDGQGPTEIDTLNVAIDDGQKRLFLF